MIKILSYMQEKQWILKGSFHVQRSYKVIFVITSILEVETANPHHFSSLFFLSFFFVCYFEILSRHHQHGRWQARIGRVAGNKDLYLGTFSEFFFFVWDI